MKGLKGMLNFIFRYIEFPGKGRASKRTFLMGVWNFGVQGMNLGVICFQVNIRKTETSSGGVRGQVEYS